MDAKGRDYERLGSTPGAYLPGHHTPDKNITFDGDNDDSEGRDWSWRQLMRNSGPAWVRGRGGLHMYITPPPLSAQLEPAVFLLLKPHLTSFNDPLETSN